MLFCKNVKTNVYLKDFKATSKKFEPIFNIDIGVVEFAKTTCNFFHDFDFRITFEPARASCKTERTKFPSKQSLKLLHNYCVEKTTIFSHSFKKYLVKSLDRVIQLTSRNFSKRVNLFKFHTEEITDIYSSHQ